MAVCPKPVPGFGERLVKNSMSGTVAGIAVCLVGHPFDTLKIRLQTQPVHKPIYQGLTDCFLKTIKWEGVPGLYRGVSKYVLLQLFKHTSLMTDAGSKYDCLCLRFDHHKTSQANHEGHRNYCNLRHTNAKLQQFTCNGVLAISISF